MRAVLPFVISLLPTLLCGESLPTPPGQIIAYLFVKDRIIQPSEIAANKLTRINYAFANVENGKVVEGFAHDRENFAALNECKKANPGLAILVSVGGWTWSKNFSDAALTKQSRKIFIDSAVDFVKRYNLDGLDIDWEYPAMDGDHNKFRPEDKQNYTRLLKELRQRFDKEQRTLNRHLLTSIATGSSQSFLDHTEMKKVQRYVDTVNLMAYDYYEPSDGGNTGHHAPLYTNPNDPKHVSADASLHLYEAAGVHPKKIVLGVPFYGHVWGEVADQNHGLYQPGKPVPNAFADFGNIDGSMLKNGYQRYWDASASVPFLYNAASHIFVSYEDEQSIALKCRYIEKAGLAGVMFWEYSNDPSGKLLNAVSQGLRSPHTVTRP